MKTLFLMPNTWDLALDMNGNIAIASSTYQQAQDIASACRVFTGDMYFNQSDGIPYVSKILGKGRYPLSLYRKHLTDAALSVPHVATATVDLFMSDGRILRGQIQFTNDKNQIGVIT